MDNPEAGPVALYLQGAVETDCYQCPSPWTRDPPRAPATCDDHAQLGQVDGVYPIGGLSAATWGFERSADQEGSWGSATTGGAAYCDLSTTAGQGWQLLSVVRHDDSFGFTGDNCLSLGGLDTKSNCLGRLSSAYAAEHDRLEVLIKTLDGSKWATLTGFSATGLVQFMTGERTITDSEDCSVNWCGEARDPLLRISAAHGWTPNTLSNGLHTWVRNGGIWIGDNQPPRGSDEDFNFYLSYWDRGVIFRGGGRCFVRISSVITNPACNDVPKETWFEDDKFGGTLGDTSASSLCADRGNEWAAHCGTTASTKISAPFALYARLADRRPFIAFPADHCWGEYTDGDWPHYPYFTREAAEQACVDYGCAGLAEKADLLHFSRCLTGWTSDFRGWYQAEEVWGCGGPEAFGEWVPEVLLNGVWTGKAGAYCRQCPVCSPENPQGPTAHHENAEDVRDCPALGQITGYNVNMLDTVTGDNCRTWCEESATCTSFEFSPSLRKCKLHTCPLTDRMRDQKPSEALIGLDYDYVGCSKPQLSPSTTTEIGPWKRQNVTFLPPPYASREAAAQACVDLGCEGLALRVEVAFSLPQCFRTNVQHEPTFNSGLSVPSYAASDPSPFLSPVAGSSLSAASWLDERLQGILHD